MVDLLAKVKANLILQHDGDDELLLQYIQAAQNYAESYQKVTYGEKPLPPATVQAIIMLSSHFYESRDGSTAGFFGDRAGAAEQIWFAVNRLLSMDKRWDV